MVANSGILSSLTTTPSTQLVDKTDSPHSGLFKALHSMAQGNYTLKDGATLGFAHTFTTSGSNIQVELTAGKGFSNGQYIAVDALSATTINKPSSGALYHWVAFADDGDGTGTISIVAGTSDGVVPDLTLGLTPISLIKVQSTDTHSTVAFQTFTTSKTENKLSLGYTNSNAYTPMGELRATANGLEIDGTTATIVTTPFMSLGNSATNAGELRLLEDTDNGAHYTGFKAPAAVTGNSVYQLPADYPSGDKVLQSSSSGVLSWVTAGTGTANLTGSTNNELVTVTGANAMQGESNLTFDGSVLALTGDLNVDSNTLFVDASANSVGIGTNTPDATLHIKATTGNNPQLKLDNSSTDANHEPALVFDRSEGSGGSGAIADGDNIGQIIFRSRNDAGTPEEIDYAKILVEVNDMTDGTEDGKTIFYNYKGGTSTEYIRFASNLLINSGGADIDLVVEGNSVDDLLYVNAGTNRVGISTDIPSNILQVNITGADAYDGIQIVREDATTASGDILGGIGFDSNDGNVPSTITEASAFIAAYATEAHSASAKGGELKMGITIAGTADDTTSTTLSRIGYPSSTTATVYAGAFSRAAVATVASNTYQLTTEDSGIVIFMRDAGAVVSLPAVGATEIGVQYTIINNSGNNITGQIRSIDTANARFNGAGSYANQDIDDDEAKTFVCWAANQWQVIG